jgi:hypothetical protein
MKNLLAVLYLYNPIVVVLIVLLLLAVFPRWGYNRSWGYYPFGIIILIILLLLLL